MRVDLFDFDLPPERIALRPARPRDAARMLVVERGKPFADQRRMRRVSTRQPVSGRSISPGMGSLAAKVAQARTVPKERR